MFVVNNVRESRVADRGLTSGVLQCCTVWWRPVLTATRMARGTWATGISGVRNTAWGISVCQMARDTTAPCRTGSVRALVSCVFPTEPSMDPYPLLTYGSTTTNSEINFSLEYNEEISWTVSNACKQLHNSKEQKLSRWMHKSQASGRPGD